MPIAFTLDQSGRVAQRFTDILVIETGPVGGLTGLIEIAKPVAYAGEDGPTALGTVQPDEAWGGATLLDSGSEGSVSWVDVEYSSDTIDPARTYECPYPAESRCLDAVIVQRTVLVAELDRPHRYATVDVDGTPILVATTQLDGGDFDHRQTAIDVAQSLTSAKDLVGDPRTTGPRSVAEMQRLSGTIPPGTWFAELRGATITFDLDEPIEGISFEFKDDELLAFSNEARDVFADFLHLEGFVPELDVRVPTVDEPLTADEFFDALSQIVAVTEREVVDLGGVPAVRYDLGREHDPAFDCDEEQRFGLSDDAQCFVWGVTEFGPLSWFHDETAAADGKSYYIESLGLLVGQPADRADPDGAFAELFDSMTLTRRG